MKRYSRIVSSILSIVIAGLSVCMSANAEETSSVNYSILSSECKDQDKNLSVASASAADVVPDVMSSGELPFDVFDIYNAHMAAESGTVPDVPEDIYRESWGIDVSQWQGDINWQYVKDSGVDFAIIRSGYGKELNQEDPKFRQNMAGAQAAGIDCGTYWYSYALTVEEAYQEAEVCYEIIKDYDFTYPVYFDIEDPSQMNLSTAEISAIVEAFCTRLKEKGCYVGVYSCASFLTTKIYDSVLEKYDVWVAHYTNADKPDFYGDYGMWQYTSNGASQVNGIYSESLDLDHCYINYPYVIAGNIQTPENPITPPANNDQDITAKGIDVSVWQGDIDWKAVAADDVGFAVIRAGYGMYESQTDSFFEKNYTNAKAAGLDVGAYWYSYAKTPEEAVKEAEVFCKVIEGCRFEYPLYVNIEESVVSGLSNDEVKAIADAFCSYVESKGYFIGIMGSVELMNSRFDDSVFKKYAVWISQFGVPAPAFSRFYGMWQYSASGAVSGISGAVDCNYCYDDYPEIIKNAHLNGF